MKELMDQQVRIVRILGFAEVNIEGWIIAARSNGSAYGAFKGQRNDLSFVLAPYVIV